MGLDATVLNEATREAWGSLHPSHMGGEYLPPLRKGEVEIARISLASVTADQICVRAQRARERIRYRVVDEYPETSTYVCHPASSVSPLSLGELIALMERASEGGSIIVPILAINSRYSTKAELAAFITVTSDFYTDLGGYYRALTDAWLEKRAREESNGSVAGGSAVPALLDGGTWIAGSTTFRGIRCQRNLDSVRHCERRSRGCDGASRRCP